MPLNYITADQEYISDSGLVLYWVVFGLMAGSAIGFGIFTFMRPMAERSHGYCTMTIVTIAATAYYSMAAWGGSAPILAYTNGVTRPIYWARYVDWTFTTPLLLMDLLLMTGMPIGHVLWIIFSDVLMVVLGLFGATSSHRTKWGWYVLSCLFLLFVNIGLLWHGVKYAYLRSKRIGLVYTGLAIYLSVAWWGYPLVWGFAEGSNTITPNAEAYCYGGLDIVTKVFFGWTIIFLGPLLARQNQEEYAKGAYLPVLLEAPVNGILSPSVATAKNAFGGGGINTTTNPVASHGNGVSSTKGDGYGTTTATNGSRGNGGYVNEGSNGVQLSPVATESTLGPHAINSSNTSTTV